MEWKVPTLSFAFTLSPTHQFSPCINLGLLAILAILFIILLWFHPPCQLSETNIALIHYIREKIVLTKTLKTLKQYFAIFILLVLSLYSIMCFFHWPFGERLIALTVIPITILIIFDYIFLAWLLPSLRRWLMCISFFHRSLTREFLFE